MDVNASNNVINLFEKPNAADPALRRSHRPQKRGYRAIEFDDIQDGKGNEEWFRVHGDAPNDLPNSVELFRYIDLLKVYSPLHQRLMIACQDATFQIEGQNLEDIPYLIQDRRLRALYLFNPIFHIEPQAGEPVIHSLERVSMIDMDE